MITKDITFNPEASEKLKAGVDKLANVVKSTLGPGGTNVILQYGDNQKITKDGVSVAETVWLDDPIENIGAQIVKQAARKTVMEAGDGTTTATVLAQAILSEGYEHGSKGANLIEVKRGIDMGVKAVVESIKAQAVPIKEDDVHKIAIISSNGDQEIGKLVGDAITQVGLDGMVIVEDSKSYDTYLKKVEGMRWDRGFMSPYFAKDGVECVLDNPVILVVNDTINSMRELGSHPDRDRNFFVKLQDKFPGRPLLIVAKDFGQEIITTIAYNVTQNRFQACLVQAPEFGDVQKHTLGDIAAAVAATLISKEAIGMKDADPKHLGQCERVRVTQWTTTIIGGAGGLMAQKRASEIKSQMADTNEHALEVLKVRLARLISGIMMIHVGGSSELEIKEKKDRIDDALNATRAAIAEGVVPGGGVALVQAMINVNWDGLTTDENHKIGVNIVRSSLPVPARAIAENVGFGIKKGLLSKPDDVIARMMETSPMRGFNAQTLQFEDLVAAGVIDPAKVVRLALENGAGVAGMLLTTKAIVSNKAVAQ